MTPLNRKLVRDLSRLRGQLLTIALVVAAGVAAFVTMRSAHEALVDSRASFYAEERFGDVFAYLCLLATLFFWQGWPRLMARKPETVEA